MLFNKKNKTALTEVEQAQFVELSKRLAPIRLDPTLKVTSEDSLTQLVRENLNARIPKLNGQKISIPADLSEQVDNVLNDLFTKTVFLP